MTRRQLWAAPLSLLLAAGCCAAAVFTMPPASYLLMGAAAAFGVAGLFLAEERPPEARDAREAVEAANAYHLFAAQEGLAGGRRRTWWQRLLRRLNG